MEKFPSQENPEESEALGLSLEDIPEELDSKEKLMLTLIEKLEIAGLPEKEKESKRWQLRKVDEDLGHIRTFLNYQGKSLPEIKRVDEMRDKIGIALAS